MNQKTINRYQHIHLIGIGGSGMSALAAILHQMGRKVTGSDQKNTLAIERLRGMGIPVYEGHGEEAIPPETEVAVYSSAVPYDNSERAAVRKRGLREMSYAEAIGTMTGQFKTIAICGTHGKTTTTGLISSVFIQSGLDPTVIIGSPVQALGNKNERLGKGDYFILEACEYCRSFMNYFPETVVITNIEVDHLDYYRDRDDYRKAFEEFLLNITEKGNIVVNCDDAAAMDICGLVKQKRADISVTTYGTSEQADFRLIGSELYHKGEVVAELRLQIPGQHNLMNAAAAFSASYIHGIDSQRIAAGLDQYEGAERRFEYLGQNGRAAIYDDYGHHPTEIRATLRTAREKFGPSAKILCIFQPHQHSRTKKLLKDFGSAFADADEVIIPNIYEVRDSVEDIRSISAEKLVEEISGNHPRVSFGRGLENTAKMTLERTKDFDLIIIMGAGDITEIGKKLTGRLPFSL